MSYMKLLSEMVRQNKLLEKRVARLETLEFTSFVGGWVEIETITVDAPTNNIVFGDIPQIFLHLAFIISARQNGQGCGYMRMIFNEDDEEDYWYNSHSLDGDTGACTHSCTVFFGVDEYADCIFIGNIPGVSVTHEEIFADLFNSETLWIPDYRCDQKKKTCHWDNEALCPEAGEVPAAKFRQLGGGFWHQKAPIDEIEIFLPGAAQFAQNSKFSLYGIGGTFECH